MANNSIPTHGGQLREIAERFSIEVDSLLDFSASICPIPPGDAMIEQLCESLRNRHVLTQYPDTGYRDLKVAISGYTGVDPSSICIANGVMPLLDATLRALGLRRCLVLAPAFGEYERTLKACGVERHSLLLQEHNNFLIDPDIVLKEAKSFHADVVLFANPHSPSGALTQMPILTQLQCALSCLGISTIVDEAFIDYCPESSVSELAVHSSRSVVFRSLTKFFAIPGFRIAYAVAHNETRTRVECALPIWPVDSLAALAARLALADTAGVHEKQEVNARERRWLCEQLTSLGWRVFPSSANFLLIKPPGGVDGLAIWRRLILEHRIVLRNCGTFEGLTEAHFRVSIRDHAASMVLTRNLGALF